MGVVLDIFVYFSFKMGERCLCVERVKGSDRRLWRVTPKRPEGSISGEGLFESCDSRYCVL